MVERNDPEDMAETIKDGLETLDPPHLDTEKDLPDLLRLLWHLRALQLQTEAVRFAFETEAIAAASLGYLGHNEKSLEKTITDLEERIIIVRTTMVTEGGRAAALRFLSITDRVALQSSQAQSVRHIKPRRYLAAIPTLSAPLTHR